ncbi:hypothetical protein [Flavobacterium sp. AG291]|uniref:hypothetical protein n=1 Tax=Flavobacterium sp. AG291 TaxID=2184000 RepID=UPI000E0A8645|nr:hypothetical protein [Flavobacterium sp. AG291]RDI06669.1 hypothetical protein DEU42_11414 [Flavobacterium sp. AG291]
MKKKKNTYLLLVLVLGIWGMVIYRFFSYTNPELPQDATPQLTVTPVKSKKREIITIDVNYRDPFLGKMYAPATANKQIPKKNRIVEPIPWPQLIYKGTVSDIKDKKKVFLVIINGKSYMMKEKETIEDITLKTGNRHSITVKYRGELTTIAIQE